MVLTATVECNHPPALGRAVAAEQAKQGRSSCVWLPWPLPALQIPQVAELNDGRL
jgi:hypothetical protein